MQRQAIDGGAAWFDIDAADRIDEKTNWDGRNHISLATGSQWEHEVLWRTKSKKWVLNSYSQRQGSIETWEQISDERAASWLIANEREHPDAAEEIAKLEI